jgi:hypothetical protein
MNLNPENRIIDGFIQSSLEELSEDEEDPLPPFEGMNPENKKFIDLYREWLNTPASPPPPYAGRLFNSIAARLNISTKKRNRDKLILNDILPANSTRIKRGLCNFLTVAALIITGPLGAIGTNPVSKENVYHTKTGNQEKSDNHPYHYYISKLPFYRPMPANRHAHKNKKTHKPLKINAYVTRTNEIRFQQTVKQNLNHNPGKRKA